MGLLLMVFGFPDVLRGTGEYTVETEYLPEISASAWGVFDVETGEHIVAEDLYGIRPTASLAKLMIASVAYDTLPLEATTTLSYRAVATEGRAGRLVPGEVLGVRELLFPLLIESSNDAAEALAEYAGREELMREMNERALSLGMASTAYADPAGLSIENRSSVHDTALLALHMLKAQPYLFDISRLSRYLGSAHVWANVNPVASLEGFRGGKHGYTDEAGRTLVAVFSEGVGDEQRDLLYVLFGSEDLVADIEELRDFVSAHVRYE